MAGEFAELKRVNKYSIYGCVTLSVHRQQLPDAQVRITITTVVNQHNWLGRLYMLPVKPMHRIIAPSVLKAIAA